MRFLHFDKLIKFVCLFVCVNFPSKKFIFSGREEFGIGDMYDRYICFGPGKKQKNFGIFFMFVKISRFNHPRKPLVFLIKKLLYIPRNNKFSINEFEGLRDIGLKSLFLRRLCQENGCKFRKSQDYSNFKFSHFSG